MRNRIAEILMVVAIVGLFLLLCIYGMDKRSTDIGEKNTADLEFNNAELRYVDKNDEIKIYVDDELRYLAGDGKEGYLEDYLGKIFESVGLKPVLITENAKKSSADCRLVIVTDKVRNNRDGENYTTPLFQMEGAMFLRDDLSHRGVLMADRLSANKIGKISYNNHRLKYVTASTTEELVEKALRTNAGFIIGDRSSVMYQMEKQSVGDKGNSAEVDKYIPREEMLYKCNVCIMTDASDEIMYDVLNQTIHEADRHGVSYSCSEKWYSGDGPVYMKDSYENAYMPIIIIIVAMLMAFFIYYMTNRNMYSELNDRMNKLRASKKELKTTFNGVRYYMAELKLNGEITAVNRAFDEYSHRSMLRRKIWEVLQLQNTGSEALTAKLKDAAAGITGESIEIKVGKRLLSVDMFPIENGRGATDKILFMAIDVTDERMAKQQLLQNNKMIAVGQLAAGVAHEIRNPLGIIRNYCYVLKNINDEEVRAKAIDHIEKAVDASGSIINNLLDFSRLSTGKEAMIDIEEHINSIVELNESILRKKNISLRIISSDRIKTFIAVEAFDMVIINLISNAADAVDHAGQITVRLEKIAEGIESSSTGTFAVAVSDTGEGIEESIVEEIFNPFFSTKGSDGTGLGLYIVYNEIEKMDGRIEVESTEGIGSTFTVTLPLKETVENKEDSNDQRKSQDTGR